MRRTLGVATIVFLMLMPAAAFAGRGRGGGHGGGGHNRVVVRDHRGGGGGGRTVVRDHRSGPRHVRVNGGRYVFPGGVVRVYKRPVIRTHYYNRSVRPAIIVEQYDPVPGYVWVSGGWSWGGAEWVWTPGYWSVAAEPVYVEPPSAGVSVSAGISIH